MRTLVALCLAVAVVALLVSGCSEDPHSTLSTAPADAALTADTGPMDVLIGFSAGKSPEAAIRAGGGAVKRQYKHFPVVSASLPAAAVDALRQNPNIRYVEENMVRLASAQTLDWGVDRIDAEYVHGHSSYDGAGVDVAVLDTGGDQDHPDITWAGGHSVVANKPSSWDDKNGHGTHCAGIISANNNDIGVVGVAPGCDIWAVQIGRTQTFWLTDILDGIDWVIATHYDSDPDNDIQVMSMSYGGGYSSAEEDALVEAYGLGILEVAAAGNSGGSVEYPAALSCVMAVSASNSSDGIASYSCYGSEIELIGPGSDIYSTYKGGGYATISGTSMSCPMVAGAAAMAWQSHSGYSRDQIRNLLKNTAQDIGLSGDEQGSGLVDAENATLGTTNGDDYSPGGADTMHVASIHFGNNPNNLYTYVTIHDEACVNLVSGAYVALTLHHEGGGDYNFGGTTGADGTVKFTLRGISSGMCFTATVTGVSKDGWFYNEASNHETSDYYCIP